MKRYLVYSLVFHILLVSSALFLFEGKKEKSAAPFYARIITPDELKSNGSPEAKRRQRSALPRLLPGRSSRGHTAQRSYPKEDKAGIVPSVKRPVEEKPAASRHDEGVIAGRQVPPLPGSSTASGPAARGGQGGVRGSSGGKSTQGTAPSPNALRERIFDKEIIGKFAHKEPERPKPDANLTFDTKEFKYYGYMQRLKEKIESVWNYPSEAAERGIYGDLYIQFTITKDGHLGSIELVRTSGHRNLDDAAIRALKNGDPYWPLPADWGNDGLTITGHFIYSLGGIFLR